jgi:hypothetical protein
LVITSAPSTKASDGFKEHWREKQMHWTKNGDVPVEAILV